MKDHIFECSRKRDSETWCHISDGCVGWGCRLLLCVPDKIPADEKERASLFSKAYALAERNGILDCPYFDELAIDRAVEDDSVLNAICQQNRTIQTVLLSEENPDKL
ncbi:MAG: hypothetical protein IJW68_03280 [Bacteroidaceae bacterium]|nr:hypothetical protein [Bacteroidaceae bacterium]